MDIQHILGGAQDLLTARRVFGEPIRVDDATIIPVAAVRGGGGGGEGHRGQEPVAGGGVGFGVDAKPAGVFVVRSGEVAWRPALDLNRVILGGQIVAIVALLALRPVVLQMFSYWRQRQPALTAA